MGSEGQVRVLHVDDDAEILEVTKAFLEREGDLQVETATSADEALDRLGEGDVDCIVSDYDMPGTDGLEFLTAVRERGLEVPFILFTGHGNEAVASDAISAGVSDYLQKETGTEQYDVLANRIRNYAVQYRTEREITRVRQRYELIARAASDVIYEWDGDLDRIVFSAGFDEYFGSDLPADADTSWWLDKIHPDDVGTVKSTLSDAIAERRQEVNLEYRFASGDGDFRYVSEDRQHLYDEGEVSRVVGAFRDVTDRRRREERLDALHEANRELMTAESVDDVATVTSQAAEEILDLPINGVFAREGDRLRPIACTDYATEVLGEVRALERGSALAWEVFDRGTVEAFPDVTNRTDVSKGDTPIRSELVVPISDFGVFMAASTTADDFDDVDIAVAKVLVANVEAALARLDS